MASSLGVVCVVLCMTMGTMTRGEVKCNSWRYNVEVNNMQGWVRWPAECEEDVALYMTGPSYHDDLEMAAEQALDYARDFLNSSMLMRLPSPISSPSNSMYCWVFDVDDTTLSHVPFFFGGETGNYSAFLEWMEKAIAPPLNETLHLFKGLQDLGYDIFFLTGRYETQRKATIKNLKGAGYRGWTDLLLRQKEDIGTSAIVYKSKNRKVLEDMGYTIVGNVGDQWSDLTGYSIGNRIFKFPNPMYWVP